ncbi:hypothetical protein AAG570_002206 [Ranatra chinensis]|uniref:Nucleolar pre-ribosomal-associated protein 1 n=1 Tax=Ranatra chinensis TaxID=642074 RepID=A0ABD0YPM9_9HEMI
MSVSYIMSETSAKRKVDEMEEEGGDSGADDRPETFLTARDLREKMKTPEVFKAIKYYFLRAKSGKDAVDEDFVGDYLRDGGSFDELFTILIKVDLKKDQANAYVVLIAIQLVIIKIVDEFPEQLNSLVSSCKQFSAGYLKMLFSYLELTSALKYKRMALNLLKALASVNNYFANEIIVSLDLSQKDYDSLVEHFRPNDYTGTRTSFVRLIITLLMTGSTQVIIKLIDKKVLLSCLFPGLVHDPVGVVVPLLEVLRTHVVENREVNKTEKRHLFNTHSMLHLVALYGWNPYSMKPAGGSATAKKNDKRTVVIREPEAEDLMQVRDSVHSLLTVLMTGTKLGLAFQDSTYGTSGKKNCNQLIFSVIQGINRPWEDSLKEELVLRSLCSSPDIIAPVFSLYEPHLQSPAKFVEVSKFYCSVIKQVNIEVGTMGLKLCTKIAQTVLGPKCLLKGAGAESVLLHPTDHRVRLAALKTIKVVVEALARYTNSVTSAHNDATSYTATINQHLVNAQVHGVPILDGGLVVIPSKPSYKLWKTTAVQNLFCNGIDFHWYLVTCLQLLWQSQARCMNAPSGQLLMKQLELCAKSSDIEGFFYLVEIFVLYERVCQQLLDNVHYSTDVLNTMQESVRQLIDACIEPELKARLVIKSFELNIIIIPEEQNIGIYTGEEMLEKLCHVLGGCGSDDCLGDGMRVLSRLLDRTGLFVGSQEEVRLLCKVGVLRPAGLGAVPVAVATRHNNLASHYAAIAAAEEEAANQDIDSGHHHALTIDDYITLAKSSSDGEGGGGFGLYSGLNVSPFVPALLQVIASLECSREVEDWVQMFLVHLFHYQVSPEAYTALVRTYGSSSPVVKPILPYLESMTVSPSCLNFGPFAGTVHEDISKYILAQDASLQDPLEKLDREDPVSVELCFRHCVFLICQLSALSQASNGVVEKAATLVEKLLAVSAGVGGKDDTEAVLGSTDLSRVLGHPKLLRHFHPVRSSKRSNVTRVALAIIKACRPPMELIKQFTKKFVYELQCAVYRRKLLKCNLEQMFSLFPLDDSDVRDLLNDVVQFDASLLLDENCQEFSSWFELELYLLERATNSRILMSSQQVSSLCRQIIDLCQKEVEVSAICEKFLAYINCYDDLSEFFKQKSLNSAAKELHLELYRSVHWHRGLLERLCRLVGEPLSGAMLSEMPVDRLTLVASDPGGGLKSGDQEGGETSPKVPSIDRLALKRLDNIVSALKTSPPPNWTSDLVHLVPHLGTKFCKKLCSRITEAAEEVVVSSGSLNFLEGVFGKWEHADTLAGPLVQMWLLNALTNGNEEVSGLLVDFLVRRGTGKGSEEVSPSLALSGQLVRLLLAKGLGQEGRSGYLTVLRLYSANLSIQNGNSSKEEQDPAGDSPISARFLFDLVTSHSLFISVLLAENRSCLTKLFFPNMFQHLEAILSVERIQSCTVIHPIAQLSSTFVKNTKQEMTLIVELVKLLYVLVRKDNSVMKREHVRVYLSAYNASLSKTDAVLLQIMREYESNGFSMLDSGCRIWGRLAADHYSVGRRGGGGPNAMGVAVTSDDFNMGPLDMLRRHVVEVTITKFPIWRRLKLEDGADNENGAEDDDRWDGSIYDPLFLLAALRSTLETADVGGNLPRRVARSGAASILLACLTSEDQPLRSAAYYLLYKYTQLLDRAIWWTILEIEPRFISLYCHRVGIDSGPLMDISGNELILNLSEEELFCQESSKYGQLVGHFLDAVRGGVRDLGNGGVWSRRIQEDSLDQADDTVPAPRLSSIVGTFLARAFTIACDPHQSLYSAIHNFLLAKPFINLNTVPAFFELFTYKDVNQKEHQHWILEVMRDGMRTPADLQLALNSFSLKIILDYYSSSLASEETRSLIVEIVRRCLTVADMRKNLLIREYSILSWIGHDSATASALVSQESDTFLCTLPQSSPHYNLKGHILQKVAGYRKSLDAMA